MSAPRSPLSASRAGSQRPNALHTTHSTAAAPSPSRLGAVAFAVRDADRPLLVLGPSLGTSVTALWCDAVPLLTDRCDVLGWDLPGHGTSPAPDPAALAGLTMADLAAGVLDAVAAAQAERGDPGAPFVYAGVSVGGAVGQQLLADRPDRLLGAALICTTSRFGTAEAWLDRADLVARAGTPTQVTAAAQRWFAPGFVERRPDVVTRLLASLQTADRFGYAAVCRALASFDLTGRLAGVTVPVVAVAGAEDPATPPDQLRSLADGIPGATLHVFDEAAHQAPAERPDAVATVIDALLDRVVGSAPANPGEVRP